MSSSLLSVSTVLCLFQFLFFVCPFHHHCKTLSDLCIRCICIFSLSCNLLLSHQQILMILNSAPVTSNHKFIMADGVPDTFSFLFSVFLGFSDFFQVFLFWLLCMLTVFWSSCWESNFRAFQVAHEISQCVLLCGHFFSFLDMVLTVFL